MLPTPIFGDPYDEVETYNVTTDATEWAVLNSQYADFLNEGSFHKSFAHPGVIDISKGSPLYLGGPVALLEGAVLEPRTTKMTREELAAMDWDGIALLHVFYFEAHPDEQHVRMCRFDKSKQHLSTQKKDTQ
jgi:hypothetical protein